MNFYASTTDGNPSSGFSLIHSDSHYANAIVVPDTELLFTGSFHRSGLDLVLTGHDGRHHVVAGYFASEHPPALMAPNGAHLTPDVVELLAGSAAPNEYAQAQSGLQSAVPPDSVGKVQKVTGTVTVLRNGVSVAVNVGDVVYKSDVILTAADSKCGITFPDGTALELLANTRMALNEYNYDASSTSNQALFTLVEGTFGFVAGKVAHTGDMKIGTPVATMGIRGTTGVIQHVGRINATSSDETYSFSVYDDPGTTRSGSWDMTVQNADGTTSLIATVSQTGYVTYVTPQGVGLPPLVTTVPLSAAQVGNDQLILQDLFDTFALGGTHALGIPGSGDNPLLQVPPNFFPDIINSPGPFTYNYQPAGLPSLPGAQDPQAPLPINPVSSNIFIWNGQGVWPTGGDWNNGHSPGQSDTNAVVIVESGDVQYNQNLVIFSLTIDAPAVLDIIGGGLTVTNGLDIFGTLLVDGDPPIFVSYGNATIESGGHVTAGALSVLEFSPNLSGPVNAPVIVENFGTVTAQAGGDIEFIDATVTNEAASAAAAGEIESSDMGSIVDFTDVTFTNGGTVIATESGGVFFVNTAATNDAGASITAEHGGIITFATSSIVGNPLGIAAALINAGHIAARSGGEINIEVAVTNAAGGRITSSGRDSLVSFTGNTLDNFGVVRAGKHGTITFSGETIINEAANTGVTPALPGGRIAARDYGHVEILGGSLDNDSGAVIRATDHGSILLASTDSNSLGVTNFAGAQITAADNGSVTFKNVGLFNNAGATITARDDGIVRFVESEATTAGITNAGTIQAEDHGIVVFDGVGSGDNGGVINTGGLIEADGCGAKIELSQSTIVGGTLQTRHGGKIETVHGDSTFLGVTLNGALVQLDCHTALALDGTTTIDQKVEFTGPGVVTMAYQSYEIVAGVAGGKLINDATIKGLGQIGLGDGALKFDNEGVVKAELEGKGHGDEFIIDTGTDGASPTTINSGTLEASAHATLLIEDSTVDNTGGLIAAYGHGAVVDLVDSDFIGGTFDTGEVTSGKDGRIEVAGNGNVVTFDGSDQAVTVDGFVQVDPGATLQLIGTIDNDGTIDIDGSSEADLEIVGTVVLDGGGVVTLEGSSDAIIGAAVGEGSTRESKLENFSTIDGAGSIIGTEDAPLKLINEAEGTIIADGGEDTSLVIDTGNNRIVNHGLMEAVCLSELDIESRLDNSGKVLASYRGDIAIDADVDNRDGGLIEAASGGRVMFEGVAITNDGGAGGPGAVIEAKGECSLVSIVCSTVDNDGTIEAKWGGTVVIADTAVHNGGGLIGAFDAAVELVNSTIYGGTLATCDPSDASGGVVEISSPHSESGNTVVFDGSGQEVTSDAFVQVDPGAMLELIGTIDNDGTIEVDPARGPGATLAIDGAVYLDGNGVVTLAGSNDWITGVECTGSTLYNDSNIDGAGRIGGHGLALINEDGGHIIADGGECTTLVVDTGWNQITNDGVMEAVCASELDIDSELDNFGRVIATYGGEVVVAADVVNEAGARIVAKFGGLVTLDGITVTNVGGDEDVRGGRIVASGEGSEVSMACDIIDNAGTIAARHGGQVDISDSLVNNCGGLIVSAGKDSFVVVADSKVIDGNISIRHEGNLDFEGCGDTLDGVSVDAGKHGNIDVGTATYDGTVLTLTHGATIAGGTLTIAQGSALDIESSQGATLDGVDVVNGGAINVDAPIDHVIVPLLLDDGTTIAGGEMSVGNQGLLDIESPCGATLDGVTVDVGRFGHIEVGETTEPGSILMLDDDTVISGGTLFIGVGSALDIESRQGATLDGVDVENLGTINVDAAQDTMTVPLVLEGDTTIIGGTLAVGRHGALEIEGRFGATLDDVTVQVDKHGEIEIGGSTPTGSIFTFDDGMESAPSGSVLMIEDGTTIAGGTLMISRGSALDVESREGAALDGVDVANDGTINVDREDETPTVPLVLDDGTTITGGTLAVGNKGLLDVESRSGATLDDVGVEVGRYGHIEIGESTPCGATLVLDHGSAISGGTLTIEERSTLDIESEAGATLDGVDVRDDGNINVDPGKAVLTLDDGTTINGEGTLTIGPEGTVDVACGVSTIGVDITNNGRLYVQSAKLIVEGAVCGTGTDTISSHGVLDFTSTVAAGQTVDFADQTGTLEIAHGADFSATIMGFGAGDNTIDLRDIAFAAGLYALWVQSTGTLEIFKGATLEDRIALSGTYAETDFALVSDGSAGTDIVYAVSDEWTDTAGGAWNVAANWTDANGNDVVPDAALNAVIDESGKYTITAAYSVVANSLTISDHHATLSGSGTVTIPTIDNDGVVDASGGTLKIFSLIGITNDGTLESSKGADLIVDGAVDNTHGLIQIDAYTSKADFTEAVSGGHATIAGGTLEFDAAASVDVTFANGDGETHKYGVLLLTDAGAFSGEIGGFTGTGSSLSQSDAIDLAGFKTAKTVLTVGAYDSADNTTSVTVTDSADHLSANLTFVGHYEQSDFALKGDNNGGTYIFDPPADANPLSADAAQGTLSFADSDAAGKLSASVTPEGQNYVGNLTVGAVSESNGTASVDYGFSLGNDQINVAAGETVTQSYEVSLTDAQNPAANATATVAVTIGGAGNDSFVFAPGVGTDTVLNFNPHQDTIELDHFADAQTVQELQSLMSTDTHGNAVLDLGNHDVITFANTTQTQLQQAIQAGHVLLH